MFWTRLCSKFRWKNSRKEFEWLDRQKNAMDRRVKESIESLETGMSPRSAILMPTRLTHSQIATIVGLKKSEVERLERDSKDRVGRMLIEDEHRRELAGSELSSYIDAVAERMARVPREEPSSVMVKPPKRWWIGFTEQLAVAIPRTAPRLIGAIAIVAVGTAAIFIPLRQSQTRVVSRGAADVPLSAVLSTSSSLNSESLSASVVSRLARQTYDVAYETRRLARQTRRGGTSLGGGSLPIAGGMAGALSVDVARNAFAAGRLVMKVDGLFRESVVGWWSVDGVAGQVVSVTATSDAFDTVVRLLSPDGEELDPGFRSRFVRLLSPDGEELGPGFRSRFVATLAVNGRYRVRVTAGDGGTGPYAVAVRTVPVTPLALDAPASGELREDGVAGEGWAFDGVAGQVVNVTATSDAFDTVVRLLSPDGEELAVDDNGGPGSNSSLEAVLPVAGRYQVLVTAFDGETGSYAVAVRTVPVTPLMLDAPASGELREDGVAGEGWAFDGVAGQVVNVTATSDAFDTVVRLLSPDGEEFGPGFRSRFVTTLPVNGRYRVRVTAGDGGTGPYAVAVRTVPVTPLALDAPASGELREDGVAGEGWAFDGVAGQVVSVTATSDAFDTVVRLLSPDGEELAVDDNGGPGSNSSLEAVLPVASRYQVLVTAFDGETGPYAVAVRTVPVTPLALDAPASGELREDGVAGEGWVFDGVAGQVVSVTATSDAFDTVVRLLSPDGEVLAVDDDGGPGSNSSLEAVLPVAGRYQVRVTAFDGETGPYAVAVRTVPVTPLALDAPASGELREDGVAGEGWVFDGVAGQVVNVTATSDAFDTVVRLLSPDGEELAVDDDGGPGSNSSLEAVLPVAGRYQVRVTAFDGETGSYAVAVRTVPGLPTGYAPPLDSVVRTVPVTPLALDAPASGELREDGVAGEGWAFDGVAGQVVNVTATSDAFDTVVRLLSPDGEELAVDDNGGPGSNSSLEAVLPVAGRYQVLVTAFDGETGSYAVAVRTVPVTPLMLDAPASGELREDGVAGEGWAFDGVAGQVVSVTATSDAFDTVVRLLSPDGEVLAVDDDGGPGSNSSLEAVLPVAGRYQVRVLAFDGETGSYAVAVNTTRVTPLEMGIPANGILE